MEIIELEEYTLIEKKNIAKKHLIKKQKTAPYNLKTPTFLTH